MTSIALRIAGMLMLVAALCACGPSAAKKLATREAIRQVQDLRDSTHADQFLFDRAAHALAMAKDAGNPGSEADTAVTLDLDFCARTDLSLYSYWAADPTIQDEKGARDALGHCIGMLQADVR